MRITTRQDLSQQDIEFPKPGDDIRPLVVRTTSGTTGGAPILHIHSTGRYKHSAYAPLSRFLVAYGLLSAQVGHALAILRTDCSPDLSRKALFLFGADLTPELRRLTADFDPECLRGAPTFLFAVLETIGGPAFPNLSVLAYSAERLSPEKRVTLSTLFPQALILSAYAAGDFGRIGEAECEYLPPGGYHAAPGVTVELFQTDENGIGEILVSNEKISRYAVGDLGRFLDDICPCGRKIFEVLGRANFDYVKLAGALVRVEELDRVMRELSGYIRDYRAIAREEMDGVRVRGALDLALLPTPALARLEHSEDFIGQEIARRLFLTTTRTLADLVRAGVFLPPKIRFVESFPFERKVLRLRLAAPAQSR